MFNFFNKSDAQVKDDVVRELDWDPSITASKVKVSAKDGIITLRGSVPHFIERMAAESAAQRVGGVKAVADELEVHGIFEKTDEEICAAALHALKWNYSVPAEVKVSVSKGWVTLSGQADWDYQRSCAVDAVNGLIGVVGVTSNMTLKPTADNVNIKNLIEAALKRSAESEGRKIEVTVDGDKVTLSGKVHSFAELEDARFAAWNAPGVLNVQNNLVIEQ